MATLRLFAAAREAAGEARADVAGATVADVLAAALERYGDDFARILASSRVWLNGQPATGAEPVSATDTIAVLPPVSGGATVAIESTGTGPAGSEPGAGDVPDGPRYRPGATPPASAMLTSRTELDRLSAEIARLTADLATFGQGSAADLVKEATSPEPTPDSDPSPVADPPPTEIGEAEPPAGAHPATEPLATAPTATDTEPGADEPPADEPIATLPQATEAPPAPPRPDEPATRDLEEDTSASWPARADVAPEPSIGPDPESVPDVDRRSLGAIEAEPVSAGAEPDVGASVRSAVDPVTSPVGDDPRGGVGDVPPASESVWAPAPSAAPESSTPAPVAGEDPGPDGWTEASRPGWGSGVSFGSGPATSDEAWSPAPGWPPSEVTWATAPTASTPAADDAEIDDKWERIVAGADDSPPARDDPMSSAQPVTDRPGLEPGSEEPGEPEAGRWDRTSAPISVPEAPTGVETAPVADDAARPDADAGNVTTGNVTTGNVTTGNVTAGDVDAGDLDFGDVEGVVKTWVADRDDPVDPDDSPLAAPGAAGGVSIAIDDLIVPSAPGPGSVLTKPRDSAGEVSGRRLAPERARASRAPVPLAVVSKSTGAHGRLGLAWTVVTVAAILLGPGWVGLWLGGCAAAAALQTAKVWRARGERPLVPIAAAIGALIPLCAISGPRAVTDGIVAAVVLALVARVFQHTSAPARDVALTLMAGLPVGLAAASVVLLRHIGSDVPLLLLAYAVAYDAAAYLVGTGARSVWEGPIAGVITLLPVALLSATIMVPPFPSGSPLLLGLVAAVLTPCGPPAASALLGEREVEAPALRRLDSLLVLAPAWAWCAAALLL